MDMLHSNVIPHYLFTFLQTKINNQDPIQSSKKTQQEPFTISKKNLIYRYLYRSNDSSIFSHPKALGVPKFTTISPTVSCLQPVTMMRSDLTITSDDFMAVPVRFFSRAKLVAPC